MFVDECNLLVRSGAGGNGIVAFLREKFRPWGGPAGGDGGRGGDIIFLATRNEDTLLFLSRKRKIVGGSGCKGENKQMAGRDAADEIVPVPVGTVVKDAQTGQVLFDFTQDGQREVICRGGQGGFGNWHFATAIHRTPRVCEPGQPGEERRLRLELKLIADVGLAGLPNAGKSSLLARLSAARPKIADYPFTTLVPMVGVVDVDAVVSGSPSRAMGGPGDGRRSFVLADIPGLIEGAHEGKGLGVQFLKHIERTRLLLHVIDLYPPDGSDPFANFVAIRRELREYSKALGERPALIAANKIDLSPDDKALKKLLKQVKKDKQKLEVFPISCATGAGIPGLTQALYDRVRTSSAPELGWGAIGAAEKQAATFDQETADRKAQKGIKVPAAVRAPAPASALVAPLPEAIPVPPEPMKARPMKFMPMPPPPKPIDPANSPIEPSPSPKELKEEALRPDLRRERRKSPPGLGQKRKLAPFQRKGRRGKR